MGKKGWLALGRKRRVRGMSCERRENERMQDRSQLQVVEENELGFSFQTPVLYLEKSNNKK